MTRRPSLRSVVFSVLAVPALALAATVYSVYTTTDPSAVAQDYVLAGPASGSGAAAFRALTATAIPSLDASKVTTGTLGIARIPTGTSSSTVALGNDARLPPAPSTLGNLVYDTGSAYTSLADAATGQVLASGGAGAAPAYSASPTVTNLYVTNIGTDSSHKYALPAVNGGNVCVDSATQTLTNKSIAASEVNSGTLAKAQGGLGQDVSTGLTNDQVVIVSGGAVGIGALTLAALPFSGALVVTTSDASITNTTDTQISWDSATYDVGGWFDTTSSTTRKYLTVPSGVQRVECTGNTKWASSTSGTRYMHLQKNSTFSVAGAFSVGGISTATGGDARLNGHSTVMAVSAGDRLQIDVWQNAGSTQTIKTGENWFACRAIN